MNTHSKMSANRLIYFIVAAFIAGNMILIFIKYNSDKNINNLINGNEKLLKEFKVSNELKTLESDVVLVESKIRGTVSTDDTSYIEGLEMQMAKVETDLDKLQKISDDDSSETYIDQLDHLVKDKMEFSNQVIDTYTREGKTAAESIIANQRDKRLTDSILQLTQKIASVRQNLLSHLTDTIDQSVKKVQRSGSILIVFVLISTAIVFWYIINTIRTQSRLIDQVTQSGIRAKEAARVKENFLANMSHEIRTPMNAILGFTNLLQNKKLDPESTHYVQTIQRSGENLLSIINDILDLSKIEAGMMRIESAPFSIRGLVNSIETMFRPKADDKEIEFTSQIDSTLPDILEGDATRLTQILVNLAGNAIKFTARGKVSINVRNEGQHDHTVMVGIEVRDTGIGIDKDKLDHVFERFEQADDAVTREYGGTGLGLSIVKDLVELQHGNIRAESSPGAGTSFFVSLPYRVSRVQLNHRISEISEGSGTADLHNVHILVVEDNMVNQNLLEHMFRNWQVNFTIANNGVEAIERLKTGTFDLILMDIQMPRMDGYTATNEIRNNLRSSIPIIAMTAHAMAGEKEKCLSYGMNEYISKPVSEEQLKKLVAQFAGIKIAPVKKTVNHVVQDNFYYIDLGYMKEVSAGNTNYEREVTMQFLEAIPEEIKELEQAVRNGENSRIAQIAHNMKTTISVMGLNQKLQPYLDSIEYAPDKENDLEENIAQVKRITAGAMKEAELFLETITT